MQLMSLPGSPSGHTDVSAFSAAPCAHAARTAPARRDGADSLAVPSTSLARRGRFSSFTQRNHHAQ